MSDNVKVGDRVRTRPGLRGSFRDKNYRRRSGILPVKRGILSELSYPCSNKTQVLTTLRDEKGTLVGCEWLHDLVADEASR